MIGHPFFRTWELHGKYPAILSDAVVGIEATKLFADAKSMLDKIISEQWLEARAFDWHMASECH